jgi:hypothetical protein
LLVTVWWEQEVEEVGAKVNTEQAFQPGHTVMLYPYVGDNDEDWYSKLFSLISLSNTIYKQ